MSLCDEVIGPTISIPGREVQAREAVVEASSNVYRQLLIGLGNPSEVVKFMNDNEEVVHGAFYRAKIKALKKVEVLDGDGRVISGEEEIARYYGIGKER